MGCSKTHFFPHELAIFWSDKKRRKDVRSTPIDIREEDARDGPVYGAEIL